MPRIERRRVRVYLCPVRARARSYPPWLGQLRPSLTACRLSLCAVLPLVIAGVAGCTTRQVENSSVLEKGAPGDRGVKIGRLPACEKGQVAGEGGRCVDVTVAATPGQPTTMRERLLLQDCEKAKGLVVAAVRRRDMIVSTEGHDIHLGLNAIAAECRARQEQLDICTRAGRYGPDSVRRSEEVRLRDALDTCRELAGVYRAMLAKGLRRSP